MRIEKSATNLPALKNQFRLVFLRDAMLPLASWSFANFFYAYMHHTSRPQSDIDLKSVLKSIHSLSFANFKRWQF